MKAHHAWALVTLALLAGGLVLLGAPVRAALGVSLLVGSLFSLSEGL